MFRQQRFQFLTGEFEGLGKTVNTKILEPHTAFLKSEADYETIAVPCQVKNRKVKLLIDEPATLCSDLTLVLAHGAGAGMESEFMETMAKLLCGEGLRVVRFEFPYMAQRREGGSKRPPDRVPQLLAGFESVIAEQGGAGVCVAAGKSMGGRMASMMLAQRGCKAAVSLGYPFHPPRQPEKLRNQHWPDINNPWLIVQGSRDPFGTRDEVTGYNLPRNTQICWLEDGDHDFKPRRASGLTQQQHWQSAAGAVATFVRGLI